MTTFSSLFFECRSILNDLLDKQFRERSATRDDREAVHVLFFFTL